jgi:uncharacterized protein YkwD
MSHAPCHCKNQSLSLPVALANKVVHRHCVLPLQGAISTLMLCVPRHLRPVRKSQMLNTFCHRSVLKSALLFWLAPTALGVALAAPTEELGALINEYRNQSRQCGKTTLQAAGPLTPHAALNNLKIAGKDDLGQASRAGGYIPAKVEVLQISGVGSPSAAMTMLKKHYCEPLMDSKYVDIGVSRTATSWRVVLARPVVSANLKDWPDEGREILKLTNEARAQARNCGQKNFKAVGPLTWNAALGKASLAHSRDMASQNYFSHRSKNGTHVDGRVDEQGYAWRVVGENIAAGQGSAQQAVSGWLSSPSHCANLMRKDFSEMGAAYAIDKNSDTTIYWTQVFATPR